MIGGKMGKRYITRLEGRDVTVRVVEIEQRIDSRHRGEWVCIDEETGRKLWRTDRRLRPLPESEGER